MSDLIKTIQQTFLEVAHAQRNGSAWYTKGDSGLYQQVSLWLGRGQEALNTLEKQLAERDEVLARCVDWLNRLANGTSEHAQTYKNFARNKLQELPASAQATAKVLAAARSYYRAETRAANTEVRNQLLDDRKAYVLIARDELFEAIREEQETK